MRPTPEARRKIDQPTDFGACAYPTAMVNVTNVCNLTCKHCFIYRDDNPNSARDKMDDQTMLEQLRILRDKHQIKSMMFMGGEPMIRKKLVLEGLRLFERPAIVTNGTYGVPSAPGCLITVSLDGPREINDALRGAGVFDKVRESVFARDSDDGTIVILQMSITRENEVGLEAFVEEVRDWPVAGIAFTFYVPTRSDTSRQGWRDLRDRDPVVKRLIELKKKNPKRIKANIGALELMLSDLALNYTGLNGERCMMKSTLPLYVGQGGNFERTFCCYGNDVDCARCGAYSVFNTAYHRIELGQTEYHHRLSYARNAGDVGP